MPHAHISRLAIRKTANGSVSTGPVANANILSGVKSVRSKFALTAKLPCLAINAKWHSVLVAESRSLVTMKVSIRFAASSAKKCILVLVRKAKRFLQKRPEYVTCHWGD